MLRPKDLTVKMSPYVALKEGKFIPNIQTNKQLFHVHGTSEKFVGALSKVNSRSNPRNKVRNHWWPLGGLVILVYYSSDNEQQNAGYDHLGVHS
jgi:hypothetical protein